MASELESRRQIRFKQRLVWNANRFNDGERLEILWQKPVLNSPAKHRPYGNLVLMLVVKSRSPLCQSGEKRFQVLGFDFDCLTLAVGFAKA